MLSQHSILVRIRSSILALDGVALSQGHQTLKVLETFFNLSGGLIPLDSVVHVVLLQLKLMSYLRDFLLCAIVVNFFVFSEVWNRGVPPR